MITPTKTMLLYLIFLVVTSHGKIKLASIIKMFFLSFYNYGCPDPKVNGQVNLR